MESGSIQFDGMTRILQHNGNGRRLSNFLFPPQLGVTDLCQVSVWMAAFIASYELALVTEANAMKHACQVWKFKVIFEINFSHKYFQIQRTHASSHS